MDADGEGTMPTFDPQHNLRALLVIALLFGLMPYHVQSEPPKEKLPPDATKAAAPAIQAGLDWLARQQTKEGRWTLQTQPNPGVYESDVAATSLSVIPFLRAGHTRKNGKHQREVSNGLKFLISQMDSSGDMRAGGTMYIQGMAAIALCEAFARTNDDRFRLPAQQAIDFIVKAQNPSSGGWRYEPGDEGDTSVLSWQVTALTIAKRAGLEVPQQTFMRASAWLDSVQSENGSAYSYMKSQKPKQSMTAAGLLCRIDLGWNNRMPALEQGVAQLLASKPKASEYDVFYWYYATPLMHRYGGEEWRQWRTALLETVTPQQDKEGATAGSWYSDREPWFRQLGRLGITSFCLMILELGE
jgi:hypothetical protein